MDDTREIAIHASENDFQKLLDNIIVFTLCTRSKTVIARILMLCKLTEDDR